MPRQRGTDAGLAPACCNLSAGNRAEAAPADPAIQCLDGCDAAAAAVGCKHGCRRGGKAVWDVPAAAAVGWKHGWRRGGKAVWEVPAAAAAAAVVVASNACGMENCYRNLSVDVCPRALFCPCHVSGICKSLAKRIC